MFRKTSLLLLLSVLLPPAAAVRVGPLVLFRFCFLLLVGNLNRAVRIPNKLLLRLLLFLLFLFLLMF